VLDGKINPIAVVALMYNGFPITAAAGTATGFCGPATLTIKSCGMKLLMAAPIITPITRYKKTALKSFNAGLTLSYSH
jgi:hypothetical protein